MDEIIEALRKFNKERNWEQFHDGKNLALALSIEASELNEAYLWKNVDDVNIDKIKEELADVFLCAFMIADKYKLDVKEICLKKISRNAEKYPVSKCIGSSKKYTEL